MDKQAKISGSDIVVIAPPDHFATTENKMIEYVNTLIHESPLCKFDASDKAVIK